VAVRVSAELECFNQSIDGNQRIGGKMELKDFCAKSKLVGQLKSWDFTKPFEADGNDYASDGCIVIRIPTIKPGKFQRSNHPNPRLPQWKMQHNLRRFRKDYKGTPYEDGNGSSVRIKIGGVWWNSFYVAKIRSLPYVKYDIHKSKCETCKVMYFKFEGGEGLLTSLCY
jgi:hypothetical protein